MKHVCENKVTFSVKIRLLLKDSKLSYQKKKNNTCCLRKVWQNKGKRLRKNVNNRKILFSECFMSIFKLFPLKRNCNQRPQTIHYICALYKNVTPLPPADFYENK